jgi:hypothetical protein
MASDTYSCQWGDVIILDWQNYPTFKSTCRVALIFAGAWDIVQGKEIAPADLNTTAGRDWAARRGKALQIMYNSTSAVIRTTTLESFMMNQDAPGLWNHLATHNPATNPLFIAEALESFYNDSFTPPNDTIDAFATRLLKAQEAVAGTDHAISDRNLYIRLLSGLPNTSNWQTAKAFVINRNATFAEVVQYLQSIEDKANYGKRRQRNRKGSRFKKARRMKDSQNQHSFRQNM